MVDLTTIATQGHFGTVTDRIVAIAAQGHYDSLTKDQILSLTIGITKRSVAITITRRNGAAITKRSGDIVIQ
jgi:hypothetical protein